MRRPARTVLAVTALGTLAAMIAPASAAVPGTYTLHNCAAGGTVDVTLSINGDNAVLKYPDFSLGQTPLAGGEVEAEFYAKARTRSPRADHVGLAEVTPSATMGAATITLANKKRSFALTTHESVVRDIGFSVAVDEIEYPVLALDAEHCDE